MIFSREIWQQIRSVTASELIRALERDGWAEDPDKNATYAYVKGECRVVIHYHSGKTYRGREKTLEGILVKTGWTEDDLVRLRLVRRASGRR